jgi:prepilin-type N-terminal cleavage/methylation domain-containing protein
MRQSPKSVPGFTILELLIAMAVFLVICAAMFGLLQMSQQKFSSESQMSGSFPEARLAIDQIVRDVNVAGYPSQSMFSTTPGPANYALGPVAWSPNYPSASCIVGTVGTCVSPSDYDLIVETRLGTDTTVSWVRYHLDTATSILYRAVVPKTGGDPVTATSGAGVMVPFLSNVMNNPGSTLLAQITTTYPSMFPGGQPQPIFQYTCDTPAGAVPCSSAGFAAIPQNIRDVDVTLIVATPQRDMQTQTLKLVELNGRGHRLNSQTN